MYPFTVVMFIFHLVWLSVHIRAFLSSIHHIFMYIHVYSCICTYLLHSVCNGFIHFILNPLLFFFGSCCFNSAMECRNQVRKVNRLSTLPNENGKDQILRSSDLTMQYSWFPPLGMGDSSLRSSPSGITFSMFK